MTSPCMVPPSIRPARRRRGLPCMSGHAAGSITTAPVAKRFTRGGGEAYDLVRRAARALLDLARQSAANTLLAPSPEKGFNRVRAVRSWINDAERNRTMLEIFTAYLVTFGWAVVGSVAMGTGIIITLKLFDLSTRNVDEWELIKQGNMAMAIILASVIIALGIVVSAAIHP